jgi:membrane protein YdbS with pleckstrin-like domain
MDIVMSDTKSRFPLSDKKPLKKTINDSITFGILTLVGSFLTAAAITALNAAQLMTIFKNSFLTGLVLIMVIPFLCYAYQQGYMKSYYYSLENNFVVIRKGVFCPQEITIPYERVQDVYVDQDILDRMFGLYDVHLSSATVSSGIQAHIDGVERTAADGLRDALLQKIQGKIKK